MMKKRMIWMLALLCVIAQGAWAQIITVTDDAQLSRALSGGNGVHIRLANDISLGSYLNMNGRERVTIDLNGHKLYRSLDSHSSDGHVIYSEATYDLTLISSVPGGSIEGGKANNGGAIYIQKGSKVTANNVIFQNNSAADHAGAIWNNGTFEATNCTFENNTASDVGAIYNAVTSDGAGTATLTGCIFTGNKGTTGAGALGNALGNTVMTIDGCTLTGNTASGHGGGIWNGGTLSATNSTFTDNTANDVGAIYNAVSNDGKIAGAATLSDCTFTGNKGTNGAGALANAIGNTVMTIDGGTITGNTAGSHGGGIWNGGTLNMKGAVTVTDNKNGDVPSNVYLKIGTLITVTGSLAGSSIGVDLEDFLSKFTNGYNNHNRGVDPASIFTADFADRFKVVLNHGEACLAINYIERSWDDTNKKVVSTKKTLTGEKIAYSSTPTEGQYKVVTNAPDDTPNEWFQMGGYSDNVVEYYVVRGNVNRETIVVQGKNVHLILCDDATLTLTGGLKLEEDNKLYIHCQSYDSKMGRLMVTNKYENAAGIGSAQDDGNNKTVGELVIHGGHIEATGGKFGAGIGSCKRSNKSQKELCNDVTVYGGYVKATGGNSGAGIGGGGGDSGYYGVDGGDFVLYDGTVIAQGGEYASGVGGGGGHSPQSFSNIFATGGKGGMVYVYGGTLTATGGERASGIGSGNLRSITKYYTTHSGGKVFIKGGTVTATGGKYAAGIGGGIRGGGAIVEISGGTVTANGGTDAAGIGGGEDAFGGTVTISGGTVHANGNDNGAGIGGGEDGNGGDVTITGGTVIAKAGNQGDGNRAIGPGSWNLESHDYGTLVIGDMIMVGAGNNGKVERIYDADERVKACWYRSYAKISPCTHPSGNTYTINEDGTHTAHCKHCTVSEKAAHFNSDGSGTCICGYKDGEGYHTITIATSSNGTGYEGVGVMANVGNNKPYTLPECSAIPEGYDFAGWVVGPTSQNNGILPNEGETLLQAGENIIVTADVSIFARYQALEISLADDGDNYETIFNFDGKVASSVTLAGRRFYKDGNWNSLCLPFAVTDGDDTDGITFSGTPLKGATVLTLDNATFEKNILTLNFEETTVIRRRGHHLLHGKLRPAEHR